MKKKYSIDSISKLENALKDITSDLINIAFKDAPQQIFMLIKNELNSTVDHWNIFLKPFGLKLFVNNSMESKIKDGITSALTKYASGNVDSMTRRVAEIDWSATNIFIIKKLNHRTYPK